MDQGWDIRLCGPVIVETEGRRLEGSMPGRQGRLVFAYLVLNRERGCTRAELIDLLWPSGPPAAAESAVSALLSKLRRALGPGVLTGRAELRLSLAEPVTVDVETASGEAGRAAAELTSGDWVAAAGHARAALGIDLQTFLPEVEGMWVAEQRRLLETVRLRALEALADAGLHLGGHELGTAEQAARSVLAAAPFRESAHCLLMEILDAAGNPAEALRAFEDLRTLLRDELGTMPGPAALAVHERLLRGEPAPWRAHVASAAPARGVTWPAALSAVLDRQRLVGRAAELMFITDSWAQAVAGARRLVLVAGEPGIGKTRIVAEAARRAHDEGAVILYGRFDEEALTPYQAVVEMVAGWSAGASLQSLEERLGPRAEELGVLLPEFGPPPADHGVLGVGGAEADAQRFRFFDAVAALLAEIGRDTSLVLIFDDLHWADRPTLQLLRHLIRSPVPQRTLFLGTYRHGEPLLGHPLQELMGDLRRDGAFKRVELSGLPEPDVGELVAALGARARPEFVRALHGETEGNPFFIEEVVRHLGPGAGAAKSLEEAGVPEGVREVTARRLRRLSGDARAVLLVASVIGRDFDFDVLEAVAPLEGDAVVAALEEGVEARVLRETGRVGRYAFTHALVRATLYDSVSPLRRARLHGRVGEELVRLRGGDLDPYLPLLAHHFAQAAPVERAERAIDFALAAARRADRLLAWEEAAEHYRAALRARELAGAGNDQVRAELLLALGASEDRAGMDAEARATFRAAADTARMLVDGALLGRAALGFAGKWSVFARVDPDRERLLEEALMTVGDEPTALRARLLARLALELYHAGEPERRMRLSAEAVSLARELGDPRTLAACLDARHYALWRPETVDERLGVAAELRRVADATGDPELELAGAGWTVVDLMELGDVQGADAQLAAASRLAEALHRPIWLWWTCVCRCARAQLAGDFEQAERLADEALAIGQRGQAENAVHYHAMAMFNIRREQGRLVEVEAAVRNFISMSPDVPAWRAALTMLLIETGRPDEGRELFEALAAEGFAKLPRDANWMISVSLLAGICGALESDHAGELYRLLEPYAHRAVVVGRAATCGGSASRLLGVLACVRREWELAERHFEDALAMHARMGAKPWTAHTQVAYARLLLARGKPGDVKRARALLGEAAALAEALGMVVVAERAHALEREAGVGGRAQAATAHAPTAAAARRR